MKNATTRLELIGLSLVLLLSACTTPMRNAEQYAAQDEWMKVVLEYRKAYNKHPRDVEYKSRLEQVELKAADFYYQRGRKLMEQGNLDGAIVQFQQGLVAMPEHSKVSQAMKTALTRKEADALYHEVLLNQQAGKYSEARSLIEKALRIHPDHEAAAAVLAEIKKRQEMRDTEKLALSSKSPITLNFRQTNQRTAFEFITKSFGVNVIFDEAVKNAPVTLFAKDITFEQALKLMLTTTKTFYKKIGPNTILIAPDTKDKRGQYEDHIIRTFQLSTIEAKDMNNILKGVISVKKVIINEHLNTLVVRDTQNVLKLVEKLIEINDRKPAEIIFDVEILEVDRTKTEQLGLNFGSRITAEIPNFSPGTGAFKAALDNAVITVPNITFNYFKQDVDAKILANPKVRVINRKKAKIHIGDRVPLRSSTIQDTTGQIRFTYEYKDIGIRLEVEPEIHLDNSVTVKLGLEVSALGANLGTESEPAYSIGTRNAETFMMLRDGETAILGGLIRDEERRNRVKLPGLGDIPLVGALFTSFDDSTKRSDVLLTITPRVVRAWDLPTREARKIYSGTENSYSDKPLFAYLKESARSDARPQIALGEPTASEDVATSQRPAVRTDTIAKPVAQQLALASLPVLTFSEPVYDVQSGQEFEMQLISQQLGDAIELPIEVLFNPQLLELVRGEAGASGPQNFDIEADAEKGMLKISMSFTQGGAPKDKGELARITMRGVKPGISYLIYRTPAIRNAAGGVIRAQVRASRVVIK